MQAEGRRTRPPIECPSPMHEEQLCKAGNATLTTVPSINAMLEARIVAIRTQGPLHGCNAPGAARAADSSHGDLMGIIIR